MDYTKQLEMENIAGRRLLWAAVRSQGGRIVISDTIMGSAAHESCKIRSSYNHKHNATTIEAIEETDDASS